MYRPNREGDFLHELLKNFQGVLVSDFYPAYDSIDCPQQKCLIHLIRDMNQDLLDNPFDVELRTLTDPFGQLLREIVATIDKYGLKTRFLKRHEPAVAKYFQLVAAWSYRSEAAEGLRARLLKCQDKLFTFIKNDGVTWNNNVAEHAIKRFALYRKDTVKSLEEPGIRDYLTLLSICHTCRMRGVSFLRFLLSREQDLDSYHSKRGKPARSGVIETYADGFMPTRLAGLKKLEERNAQVKHAIAAKRAVTESK